MQPESVEKVKFNFPGFSEFTDTYGPPSPLSSHDSTYSEYGVQKSVFASTLHNESYETTLNDSFKILSYSGGVWRHSSQEPNQLPEYHISNAFKLLPKSFNKSPDDDISNSYYGLPVDLDNIKTPHCSRQNPKTPNYDLVLEYKKRGCFKLNELIIAPPPSCTAPLKDFCIFVSYQEPIIEEYSRLYNDVRSYREFENVRCEIDEKWSKDSKRYKIGFFGKTSHIVRCYKRDDFKGVFGRFVHFKFIRSHPSSDENYIDLGKIVLKGEHRPNYFVLLGFREKMGKKRVEGVYVDMYVKTRT